MKRRGRLPELLPIILPHGGFVVTFAAYFDESYQGSAYFVYGGYLVEAA